MASMEQVEIAKNEKRHELVLSGQAVSAHIEKHGLDKTLFTLTSLNFLEISRTGMKTLSSGVGDLKGLTNLMLHNNQLEELPSCIGNLPKLKTLDVSNNKLSSIPNEFSELVQLQSFNASCNKLTSFPNIEGLVQLHVLDIQKNQLDRLPEGITNQELVLLAEVTANGNMITEISPELCELPSLRLLDVSNNKLSVIPHELGNAPKLKQLLFQGNKLEDKRLMKMGNSCQTRSVLEYLRKSSSKGKSGKKSEKELSRKERKKNKKTKEHEEEICNFMRVLHFKEGVTVHMSNAVSEIRPHIVCCIVRNIDFQKENNLYKRFITMQTKLHESVCDNRQAGTIATHDLKKVKAPIHYEARKPGDIMVTPLFKSKAVSADQLVAKLQQEAEEYRKVKKRSTVSGIHKYLDLVKDKEHYACLLDKDGTVISFPPITNCDSTKISAETTDLLVEVTGTKSQDTCKTIMQALLTEMLNMGLGRDVTKTDDSASSDEEGATASSSTAHALTVEQVQVLDPEGQLKVVYPSRVDLVANDFKVIRDS